MADGKLCKRCNHQEAAHEVASSIENGLYSGPFHKRSDKIQEEYPGVCREFIDPDSSEDVDKSKEMFF